MSETTTKERPIVFSGPMVLAILDGRKTQTRRVIKPQPSNDFAFMPLSTELVGIGDPAKGWQRCPYGVPGDRLWVRETIRRTSFVKGGAPVRAVEYRADGEAAQKASGLVTMLRSGGGGEAPWLSPLHMPRWASRLTLEITAVRVERLNEISHQDARAEGVQEYAAAHRLTGFYTTAYSRLWDETHGKRHPWASNPWVWVIEFRRLEAK